MLTYIIIGAVLFLAALLLLWDYLTVPPRARSRARRRGGYIRPSLSAYVSASPGTGRGRATSTGCKTAGSSQEAVDGLALRAALSRTTAPIASSSFTVTRPGDRGTDATTPSPVEEARARGAGEAQIAAESFYRLREKPK